MLQCNEDEEASTFIDLTLCNLWNKIVSKIAPPSKPYATSSKSNETYRGYQYIVFKPESRKKFGVPPFLGSPEDKNENCPCTVAQKNTRGGYYILITINCYIIRI